jgi:hypothetical protein
MDIFGQTPVPKWLDPQETQFKWMDENRQDENAQTQRHVAMGQLALQQQEQDLRNKMGAADLVTKGMANQTMAMDLNQHIQGVDEWNNIMQQTGGDPEKIYNSPAPSSPFALQKWSSARAGYAQSVAGAAKVRLVSDFETGLADMAKKDPVGFASVNDLYQAEDGRNPDGTPSREVLQEYATQGQRLIDEKQKREESLAAIRPTIAGTYGLDRENLKGGFGVQRETIRAGAHVDAAQILADSKDYATDANKQINVDKLQAHLEANGSSFLDNVLKDQMHQKMEQARKSASPKDQAALLDKIFNETVAKHNANIATPVTAPPAPSTTGDGSALDKPKPVSSQEEYDSLPSGAFYKDSSGNVRKKK